MSYTKVGPNKYRIFISDGFNLDGSRRRFSKTVETDLKGRDLEKFLTLAEFDFEDEVKKKDPRFFELARGSFEAYSKWWMDYKINHEGLALRTAQEYQKLLDTRILKFIGDKTLEKLTNGDMLELMKLIKNSPAKTKTGRLSLKSIKHYHTILNTMFNDAVTQKILTESPMSNVPVKEPPKKLKDNFYDLEDIDKLIKLLPKAPVRYQLAVLLTISLGLRVGELSAIQWKHVNLTNRKLRIEQSNTHLTNKGSFVKDTKNTHSERIVTFPDMLVNLFRQHKEQEEIKRDAMGEDWIYYDKDSSEDFVFTQRDGKMVHVGTIPDWFRDFIRKHKLKYITFHGLRHTNATILISKKTNLVSISHLLGHASTSITTDIYGHHLSSVEQEIANEFNNIFDSGTNSGTNDNKLRIVK